MSKNGFDLINSYILKQDAQQQDSLDVQGSSDGSAPERRVFYARWLRIPVHPTRTGTAGQLTHAEVHIGAHEGW